MPLLEYRQANAVDAAGHVTKDHALRGAMWPMPLAPYASAALPSWIPFSADPSAFARLQGQQGSTMLPRALMCGENPHAAAQAPHTSVAVADAYAFTYCPICNQFGHWYSRCELFHGSVLLFFNERDQRPYLMQHFNWMQEATLRDVFQFLRVSTGLAPRQYQLLVHGSAIPMHDRRTRCCDVGLLPGAMVRVQLTADHQFLAMMPTSGQSFGQVRPSQSSPQTTVHTTPRLTAVAAPPTPFTKSAPNNAAATGHVDCSDQRESATAKPICDAAKQPLCVAQEVTADVPTATNVSGEIPASVHTPDMSGISVASTSLLRSVPGSSDATHHATSSPENGDPHGEATYPAEAASKLPPLSSESETGCGNSRPVNNGGAEVECGRRQHEVEVPSVERPLDVSRWADLSVASSLGKRSRSPNLTDQASPPPQTRGARTLYRECPSESLASKPQYRGGPPVVGATAHVKFLPSTMTFAAMRDMFFSVGEVVRVRVVDADSSIPIEKRFAMAFVEYHSPESVDRLIAAFHRARVGSFVLAVTRSMNAIKGKYHTDATRSSPCTFGLRSHAPVVVDNTAEVGSPDRASSQQTPQRAKRGTATAGEGSRRLCAPEESRQQRSATSCSALESTPPPPAARLDASPTSCGEKSASHRGVAVSTHSLAPPGGYKLAPRLGDPAVHCASPAVPLQDHAVLSPDVAHCHHSVALTPPTRATCSIADGLSTAFSAARQHGVITNSASTLSEASRNSGGGAPSTNLSLGGRMASLFTLRLPELREFVKLRELVHEFVADRVQASYFRALRFAESLRAPTANPTLKVDLLLLQCALHRCHGGKVSSADAAVAARSTVAEGAACYNACALSGSTASHVQWCMAAAAALVEDIVEVAELEVMLMTALRLSGPDTQTNAALVERLRKAQRAVRKHHSTCDGSSERPSEPSSHTAPLHGIVASTCFSHADGVAVSETLLMMAY